MDSDPGRDSAGVDPAPFVAACNGLGLRLLVELARRDAGRNVIVSPVSIAFALAMIYNGVGGRARRAMDEALGFAGLGSDGVNRGCLALNTELRRPAGGGPLVALANALWAAPQLRFSPAYLQTLRQFFEAGARSLDFSVPGAAEAINEWARDSTGGKIRSLLERSDISPDTDCVLTSAAYFRGVWRRPFDPALTRPRPFHPADGAAFDVPTMTRTGTFAVARTDELQTIRIDYAGGRFAAYVFLPAPESSLPALLETADAGVLARRAAGCEQELIELRLPRFSQTYRSDLKEVLTYLNLGILFTADADFSPMGLGGHFVEKIEHQALAEVSEEGTTAAAATAAVLGRSLQLPTVISVDRPFLWVVRDERAGALLFAALLADPV